MNLYKFSKIFVLTFLSTSGMIACAHTFKADQTVEDTQAAVETSIVREVYNTIPPAKKYISYTVPEGDTSFKSYMGYKAITNTQSPQYKLQEESWTDSFGLRRYGGYYEVALGTFYTDSIGDIVRITFDSGDVVTAVVGDFKDDCHTDSTNRYYEMSDGKKNVVEFIVDTSELEASARRSGDISSLQGFKGNVTSIERVYIE